MMQYFIFLNPNPKGVGRGPWPPKWIALLFRGPWPPKYASVWMALLFIDTVLVIIFTQRVSALRNCFMTTNFDMA